MLKPLVGSLCAAALLAATFTHAPTHSRTGTASPAASTRATSIAMAARSAVSGSRLRISVPRRVRVGSRISVRGTAPAARRGRVIVLSTRRAGEWKRIARTRATREGAFTFKATAPSRAGRTTWRVTAQRMDRFRAQAARFTVLVSAGTPGSQDPTDTAPTAGGAPSDWTYISANTSMRWDPCEAITWHYAPERQTYPGAAGDVERAIAILAAQTGYTFARVNDKSDALLTLGWATPVQEPMLKGSTIGVGGPAYQSIDPKRNQGTEAAIVSGDVTFDATEHGRPGFADANGWTWGQVFLHEVMHALGLGHARGPVQVMYPMASTTNQHFGAGDLTGLAEVGAQKGCIDWAVDTNPSRLRTALVAE